MILHSKMNVLGYYLTIMGLFDTVSKLVMFRLGLKSNISSNKHFISGSHSLYKTHTQKHISIHSHIHTHVYISMYQQLDSKYLIIAVVESDMMYQKISVPEAFCWAESQKASSRQ